MGLNKMVMIKVAVLAFLIMGFTSNFADARRFDAPLDASSFLTRVLSKSKSSSSGCCDACACTLSIPPQCQCFDMGEDCHSACKSCICALSYPPKCRCYDITDFCYESCSSSDANRAN